MKNIRNIASISLLLVGMLVTPLTHAQEQDLGFKLPSQDEVKAMKDSRKNKAASQSVGRSIMEAFKLYEEEDLQGAIAMLEQVETNTEYDKAYLDRFLGNLYAANEKTAVALSMLKEAADANVLGWNDQAAVLKLVGQLSLQEEKYEQSIDYLKKWLMFTGQKDPGVLNYLANAYYQTKQYAKIIPPARLALAESDKPSKDLYTLMMASYYERKMYDDAIDVLIEGLNKMPEVTKWWPQLAQMYLSNEQYEKALETMEIADIAGYLTSESHYRILSQLYDNNGVPYKAAKVLEEHVAKGDVKATENVFSSIASSYHRAKEWKEAAQWYSKAADKAEQAEDRAEYLRKQGSVLVLNEQYVAATTPYLKALDYAEGKDKGKILMSLAEAYFYGGDYRKALSYVNQAKDYSNESRNARSWEGYIRSTAKRKGVDL